VPGPPDPVAAIGLPPRPGTVGSVGAPVDEPDLGDPQVEIPRPTRPKGPSYTWLHLVVLALVAFVLGWVIVLLLDRSSSGLSGASARPTAVQTVADAGPLNPA
jgi:hypothetical protein